MAKAVKDQKVNKKIMKWCKRAHDIVDNFDEYVPIMENATARELSKALTRVRDFNGARPALRARSPRKNA